MTSKYVVYVFDEVTGVASGFGPYLDGRAALEASEVLRREIEGPNGGGGLSAAHGAAREIGACRTARLATKGRRRKVAEISVVPSAR
jgi:hypothetical protein